MGRYRSRRWILGALVGGAFVPLPLRAQDEDAPGIAASSTWKSPQFGTVVLWSDDWSEDDANTGSDPANLLDRLSIVHTGGTTLVVLVIEAGDEDAADYARRLVRYRRVTDPEATLVWNDDDGVTTLLYRSRADRQDIVSFIDIRLVDGDSRLHVVEMIAYRSDIDASFAAVQDGVTIDSGRPFPDRDAFPLDRLDR